MLNGTIGDITVNEILELLGKGAKTGRLELHRLAGTGEIYVRDGVPYFAQSSLSRSLIGLKFLQMGAIDAKQLRQALDAQAKTGARLGEVLIEKGWAGREQVESAVGAQIQDALDDLLDWETGEFTWEPGAEIQAEVIIGAGAAERTSGDEGRSDDGPDEASQPETEPEGQAEPTPATEETSREDEEADEAVDNEDDTVGVQENDSDELLPADYVLIMSPDAPDTVDFAEVTQDQWRVASLANGVRTVREIALLASNDSNKGLDVVRELVELGVLETRPHPVEDLAGEVAVDKSVVARELAGLVRLDKKAVNN